ncbi:hypothetical protein D3C87_1883600 [compost metagenome]
MFNFGTRIAFGKIKCFDFLSKLGTDLGTAGCVVVQIQSIFDFTALYEICALKTKNIAVDLINTIGQLNGGLIVIELKRGTNHFGANVALFIQILF